MAAQAGEADEIDRRCPLCDADDPRPLGGYSLGRWQVAACGACDFVYLRNTPVYARLSSELAWEKSFDAHARRVKKAYPLLTYMDQTTRWRLHLLRPDERLMYLKLFPKGQVLDIGCGSGARAPAPFVPFGVEISAQLAAEADAAMRARGGACVHAPAVEGVAGFAAGQFTGVLMRSFLEHEAQPLALLRETARVLAPSGVAYVKVPNYGGLNRRVMGRRWCGFRYPDHVNYFSLDSLKAMARKAGFRTRLFNPLNHPFDDNLHAALTLG